MHTLTLPLIILILSLFGKMVTILKIKLKPIDSFCLRLIDFYYLWLNMAWQFKLYYCLQLFYILLFSLIFGCESSPISRNVR